MQKVLDFFNDTTSVYLENSKHNYKLYLGTEFRCINLLKYISSEMGQ